MKKIIENKVKKYGIKRYWNKTLIEINARSAVSKLTGIGLASKYKGLIKIPKGNKLAPIKPEPNPSAILLSAVVVILSLAIINISLNNKDWFVKNQ